ncbi:MAG: nicotinate-nucleotide adenylyltransferase, partial [Actinomycetota bacterium]
MKKIAFYGGSFDPLHNGHLMIARALSELFELDEFVFIPAFHAPHKKDKKPTSAFHRFAMLCLATNEEEKIKVSKMELDVPERPYTVETLERLKNELNETEIFFVMGADSWAEITTWREWEKVLTLVNIIVVTRPDYEITFSHITNEIRERIVDLRKSREKKTKDQRPQTKDQ